MYVSKKMDEIESNRMPRNLTRSSPEKHWFANCQTLWSRDPNSIMYKINANFYRSEVRPVVGRLGPKRSGIGGAEQVENILLYC